MAENSKIKQKAIDLWLETGYQLLGVRLYQDVGGNPLLDSKNKVDYYRAVSLTLKQLSEVKKQKTVILQERLDNKEYVDEWERLDLMDRSISLQLEVLEVESNISNKDNYCSIFAEQTRLAQIETEKISKECDLYLKDYMKLANDLITDQKTKESDRSELHGYLAQIHAGFKTINTKVHLYGQLKDKVLKLQIK